MYNAISTLNFKFDECKNITAANEPAQSVEIPVILENALSFKEFGLYNTAESLLVHCIEIFEKEKNISNKNIITALLALADIKMAYEKYDEAEVALNKCLKRAILIESEQCPPEIAVLMKIGAVYARIGIYHEISEIVRFIWEIAPEDEKETGSNEGVEKECSDLVLKLNNLRAHIRIGKQDYNDAMWLVRNSLYKLSLKKEQDLLLKAELLRTKAEIQKLAGEYNEALKSAMEAADIHNRRYGHGHPETALIYKDISEIQFLIKDHKAAAADQIRYLSIFIRKCLGIYNEAAGNSFYNLGLMYEKSGALSMALDNFKGAAAVYENLFGNNHPLTVKAREKCAVILKTTGKTAEAAIIYKNFIEDKKKLWGIRHTLTLETIKKFK